MSRRGLPRYRRQKQSTGDLAFVELGGKRFYVGPWGSSESKERYARLHGERGSRHGVVPRLSPGV